MAPLDVTTFQVCSNHYPKDKQQDLAASSNRTNVQGKRWRGKAWRAYIPADRLMNVSIPLNSIQVPFPCSSPAKVVQATWNTSRLCCACCAAVDFISPSTDIAFTQAHHHLSTHHLPTQHTVSSSTIPLLLSAPRQTMSPHCRWPEQRRRL